LRLAAVLLALALSGCASLQREPAPPAVDSQARLTGRISVNVAGGNGRASGGSASFELIGSPLAGRLELSSPLGALVARAQWQPGLVSLQTPEQERRFEDLDALTRELLGEPVPVQALFDWLQSRPWAGAAHAPMGNGFEQLGWRIDLSRRTEGVLLAMRLAEPVVTLRARLDGGDEGNP
jgi:outer membrane lipoprotein LolB